MIVFYSNLQYLDQTAFIYQCIQWVLHGISAKVFLLANENQSRLLKYTMINLWLKNSCLSVDSSVIMYLHWWVGLHPMSFFNYASNPLYCCCDLWWEGSDRTQELIPADSQSWMQFDQKWVRLNWMHPFSDKIGLKWVSRRPNK